MERRPEEVGGHTDLRRELQAEGTAPAKALGWEQHLSFKERQGRGGWSRRGGRWGLVVRREQQSPAWSQGPSVWVMARAWVLQGAPLREMDPNKDSGTNRRTRRTCQAQALPALPPAGLVDGDFIKP